MASITLPCYSSRLTRTRLLLPWGKSRRVGYANGVTPGISFLVPSILAMITPGLATYLRASLSQTGTRLVLCLHHGASIKKTKHQKQRLPTEPETRTHDYQLVTASQNKCRELTELDEDFLGLVVSDLLEVLSHQNIDRVFVPVLRNLGAHQVSLRNETRRAASNKIAATPRVIMRAARNGSHAMKTCYVARTLINHQKSNHAFWPNRKSLKNSTKSLCIITIIANSSTNLKHQTRQLLTRHALSVLRQELFRWTK